MNDSEVLMCTVAVVFPPPTHIELDEELMASSLESPISVSQFPEGGTMISGARSQMEVVLHPNKLNVRELSGDIGRGANKIPRVVHSFLEFLKVEQPSSFGLNYLLEVVCENPSEWVGSRLLAKDLTDTLKPANKLRSNNLDVIVERPPKVWTIRFQVRRRDRIHIDFNSNEELSNEPLPSGESLSQQLVEQGQELYEFVRKLKG